MYTADHRTVSYSLPWDDAPIDLSFVFKDEMPAGKHGFLTANGPEFKFEDGTVARFWGTNFNSGACFPSHEYSEIVARRLAKFGMNLVRFHQMDGDWSTPNIFQFTRGARIDNTRTLDPESLDRLDYLIYALKKNGVYTYLDMMTYRRFRSGDGVESTVDMPDASGGQSNFDEHLIELQKEYCSQLWNHYNPYTKLCYKDEPAIVLSEIVNENDLFSKGRLMVEPYRTRLEERYQAWRKAQGLAPAETPVDLGANSCPDVVKFKLETQKKYFEEMYAYMRGLGVKIPITGTNWWSQCMPLIESQENMPFLDSHIYFYAWQWKPHEKSFKNESLLATDWLSEFVPGRAADRPFFISEWDEPWPNQYRAESVLYLAAVCSLQGWGGTAIHTYRYDCRPNIDMIAAPITGEALSGVPYRSGVFDAFNDPCRFGLFYHAALLFRRGDLAQSPVPTVIQVPPVAEMLDTDPKTLEDRIMHSKKCPAYKFIASRTTAAIAHQSTKIPAGAKVVSLDTVTEIPDGIVRADTGELVRDLKNKLLFIDTPRTKAAEGFLAEAGEIELGGLTIKCRNRFAVIVLSSLDDKPLAESENIFLAAVGNADNTDAKYNDDHTIQYDKGHGPIEAEVIVADITLETKNGAAMRVDAINSFGMQVGRTPAAYAEGKLKFTTGGDFPSIYYLIQKM